MDLADKIELEGLSGGIPDVYSAQQQIIERQRKALVHYSEAVQALQKVVHSLEDLSGFKPGRRSGDAQKIS